MEVDSFRRSEAVGSLSESTLKNTLSSLKAGPVASYAGWTYACFSVFGDAKSPAAWGARGSSDHRTWGTCSATQLATPQHLGSTEFLGQRYQYGFRTINPGHQGAIGGRHLSGVGSSMSCRAAGTGPVVPGPRRQAVLPAATDAPVAFRNRQGERPSTDCLDRVDSCDQVPTGPSDVLAGGIDVAHRRRIRAVLVDCRPVHG